MASFGTCLSIRELRPKINFGFDIGQSTRTLLCVGFVYCLRSIKAICLTRELATRIARTREMEQFTKSVSGSGWRRYLPPLEWFAHYRPHWLTSDFISGVTLAAYAIPVALAYATLADLPPQVGIYGYLLGGLGYALLGTSRQLAVGPTSAISLMVAGTVGEMAGGDAAHYAAIASLAGFTVALLCLISWLLRLSILVRLISDSILVGFKAGA